MTCHRATLLHSFSKLRSVSMYNLPSSWTPFIAPARRTRRCTQPLTAVELRSPFPTLNL
ncbi:hypothetical protein [Rubritalea tangerina]|uniref:hypothetical protein n=1 Tax=Rubritalea tangerina TaxID=430798 RepID=UPI00360DA0E7